MPTPALPGLRTGLVLTPPAPGTKVGVQLADGSCHSVAIESVNGPRIELAGAPAVELREAITLCWAGFNGFRRAESVVVAREDDRIAVEIGVVEPVERRMFTRHTPRTRLTAEVELDRERS